MSLVFSLAVARNANELSACELHAKSSFVPLDESPEDPHMVIEYQDWLIRHVNDDFTRRMATFDGSMTLNDIGYGER
ncbi:hypothetical protein LPL03_05450 [Lactiplantibacillus argentoratensis]|nr:hypothetical protein LJA01_08540 [Lactobacillus japonicus]GEO52449.1 hypothetical protein LPL03_05450 [Lactiplantibacillus argentoratensis]